MKKKFDEKDIEIPFAHMSVYIGPDKKKVALPLHAVHEQPEHADIPISI